MNFTIGAANRTWEQLRARYLVLLAGMGAAATAAILIAGNVTDTKEPATTAINPAASSITAPVNRSGSDVAVYYLVDSQAEADSLSGMFTDDQAQRSSILVADSPAAASVANDLTSAAWGSELGPNVHIIDLRSSATGTGSLDSSSDAVPEVERVFVHYIVNSQTEAAELASIIESEGEQWNGNSGWNVSYSFTLADSPESEQEAFDLLMMAESEGREPGISFQVIDLR